MPSYQSSILCITLTLLLLGIGNLKAQSDPEPTSNSPYSSLGLGDLFDPFYASNAGMAGLSATYHDPFHLNPLNPASLGWLRSTAFETGVFAKYANLEAENIQSTQWSGNLSYMALGFPVRNPINERLDQKEPNFGWGMAFALAPYSTVNYNIQLREALTDSTFTVGSFKGTGGTYRLNWGNGIRYKTFSAGINVGYFFGRLNNTRLVELEDEVVFYLDDFADDVNVSGLVWNIGVGYDLLLKEPNDNGDLVVSGKRLSFGAYANADMSFTTESDRIYRRVYSINSTSLPLDLQSDTISSVVDLREDGTLPASYGIGVMYENSNKFKVGVEYASTLWNNYINRAQNDELQNSYRVSIGGEFIPDYASYNNYFNRIRYRFGAFYETDPRSFNGDQLDRIALTLGFGFPITLPRQQTSFVNLAVEGGQFGRDQELSEQYIKFTLGFTLNDNTWFFKRKFD